MFLSYPKVLRYDHDLVSDGFYSAGDLTVLEKLDGSNARIIMYDSKYRDVYPNDFLYEFEPIDGEIFFGSKNKIRGTLGGNIDEIDAAFHRFVGYMRREVDSNDIRTLHETYSSPLLFFGEHMVPHSIDYGYEENPPPPFIGFDVFKINADHTHSANPLEETFDGFLSFTETKDVFTSIGIPVSNSIKQNVEHIYPDEIEEITIPESTYGQTQSEGIVIRSNTVPERIKFVRDEFKEVNRDKFGLREDQAKTGSELFTARYITNGRIRKQIHKYETTDVARIARETVYDAWSEELHDITSLDTPIHNPDILELTEKRVSDTVQYLETTAQLNNSDIFSVWQEFVPEYTEENSSGRFEISHEKRELLDNKVLESETPVERCIVELLITEDALIEMAEKISEEKEKSLGNWVIEPLYERTVDFVWNSNINYLSNTHILYTPSKLDEEIMNVVRRTILER